MLVFMNTAEGATIVGFIPRRSSISFVASLQMCLSPKRCAETGDKRKVGQSTWTGTPLNRFEAVHGIGWQVQKQSKR
jgi:hypothetical protein